MDWNKNGKLDAADLFTTELFEKELGNNMLVRKCEKYEGKEYRDQNQNVTGGTKQ